MRPFLAIVYLVDRISKRRRAFTPTLFTKSPHNPRTFLALFSACGRSTIALGFFIRTIIITPPLLPPPCLPTLAMNGAPGLGHGSTWLIEFYASFMSWLEMNEENVYSDLYKFILQLMYHSYDTNSLLTCLIGFAMETTIARATPSATKTRTTSSRRSAPPLLLLPRPLPHRLLLTLATACHASPLGHCIFYP